MRSIPLLLFVSIILLSSCSIRIEKVEITVDNYFRTYNQRKDFQKFLEFYDDKIVLTDIINGDLVTGKNELKDFFDWNNPNFKSLDSNSLIISEKIIDKNQAAIKGYFTPFQWGETRFEAMHFTTILTFNDSGKIIRQVDWINYPTTLVDYHTRKNSNDWLK